MSLLADAGSEKGRAWFSGQMKITLWWTLGFLLLASCGGSLSSNENSVPIPPLQVGNSEVILPHAPSSIDQVPLDQFPRFIDNTYRVLPDRRFLFAIARSHQLLTGEAPRPLRLSPEPDGWSISYGNQTVGKLAKLPSYADQMTLLEGWVEQTRRDPRAKRVSSRSDRTVERTLRQFSYPALLSLLEKRSNDPVISARILTRVLAQTFDQFDFADPLAGNAIAALVVASTSGADLTIEKTLLPYFLGYESDSIAASAALPETHAVRLFVRSQTAQLEAIGMLPDAQPLTQFLLVRHLTRLRGPGGAFEWLTSHRQTLHPLSLRALQTGTTIATFEKRILINSLSARPLKEQTLSLAKTADLSEVVAEVLASIEETSSPGEVMKSFVPKPIARKLGMSESLLASFEDALEKRAQKQKHSVTAEAMRSFYEANFFAAIFREQDYYRGFADFETDRRFFDSLEEPSSQAGMQVKRWIGWSMVRKDGEIQSTVKAELGHLSRISPVKFFKTFDDTLAFSTPQGRVRRRVARQFLERFDSRPEHLVQAGYIFWKHLEDYPRFEQHFRRAADLALTSQPVDFAWFYKVTGDVASLRHMIECECISGNLRAYALRELAGMEKPPDDFIKAQYQQLIDRDEDVLHPYMTYLRRRKDYGSLARFGEEWLHTHPDERPLHRAYAATMLARAYRGLGDVEKAWSALEPHLDTWKADVLDEGSLLLLKRGNFADAKEMAEAHRNRYQKDAWSDAAVVRVLWSRGQHSTAAQIVRVSRTQTHERAWNEAFPDAFQAIFPELNDKAIAAFTALMDSGLSYPDLQLITGSFKDRPEDVFRLLKLILERPELSFEKNEAVATRLHIDAKNILEQARGADHAVDWFVKQVPADSVWQAILGAYQDRQWDVIAALSDQATGEKPEQLEVLQIATLIHQRKVGGPQWNAALEQWRNRASNTFFAAAIRYLLGFETEELLATWIGKEGLEADSVTYFIALKRGSEGKVAEAADWFQATEEVGRPANPPHAWAMSVLRFWQRQAKSFDRIAAERLL